MTIWIALVLGLVQGLTEFLPVSSSGHLMLFQELFGIAQDGLLFEIILHVATLCAVIIVFRKKIWELVKKPFQPMMYYLVIATAITCVMFLVFKKLFNIDAVLGNVKLLPFMFLVTAIVLFLTTLIKPKEREVGYVTSVAAGFAQGIALIPGISRSGSTIAASLYTGAKREAAAEFAFLMSIPAILASLVFSVIDNPSAVTALEPVPLIFGFIAALVSGIFAIKIMLKVIQKVKLYWFSVYLVILSVVLLFVFYI
jgi:undecaprenyl-diphosphatase